MTFGTILLLFGFVVVPAALTAGAVGRKATAYLRGGLIALVITGGICMAALLEAGELPSESPDDAFWEKILVTMWLAAWLLIPMALLGVVLGWLGGNISSRRS